MDNPEKKFCIDQLTENSSCCDVDDFATGACNDRLENVICSNDLDYEESDEPEFKRYMICPQSIDVCGSESELYLQVPNVL